MQKFLKNIFKGNGVLPSDACLQSFNDNFPDAINVEWYSKDGYYEAIFYRNTQEYIASFNLTGVLLEYRQNILIEFLPELIKNIALEKGEIMNSVLKNKGNTLEYELIVRHKSLKRQLIVFSDIGDILEEKFL
jgi:hypothetical protein